MKKLFLTTVAALALSATGAISETIIRDGCEWRKADNGNYFTRVNPGCKIGHNGNGGDKPIFLLPEDPGDDDGDDGDDPGEGNYPEEPGPVDPGEGEEETGGGDDDGNDEGGDKPTKPGHGHGDDNHDHSGPPGQNKPKPGKGPKG